MAFDIINSFKDEILKIAGSQDAEIQLSLDEGLAQYTETWFNKISNVKTYLFYENAVKFDKVYVPLTLRFEKKKIDIPDSVEQLFKINNCITILGHAGSGKTMLMKYCFLNVLQKSRRIPVIIELRRIDNTNMSLAEYVSSSVFKLNLSRNESVFMQLMGEGRFIFFFDGYDEISPAKKELRTIEIEEFVDRYNKNYFLLTSRPGAGAENLSRFRSYHVCDLTEKQIKLFIKKQSQFMDEDGDQIADKIFSAVFESSNQTIKEYLSNPLLLSMFILTFKYTPELPSKKSGFYFNVFDTLYCKHDTTSKSGGYIHERKCKMEKDQYLSVLESFSYNSYFYSKYEFDNEYINSAFEKMKKKMSFNFNNDDMIYDLSVSIGIWLLDGLAYNFPHRSMQEYFAALLISKTEEEVRKVVYNNVLTKKYSQDGYNFWSLCQELDEFCFKKHFVLHNLNEFVSKLLIKRDSSSDEKISLMLNFLEMMEFYIKINERNEIYFMRHKSNLYVSIIRFLDKSLDLTEDIFIWPLKHTDELRQLQKYKDSNNESMIKMDANNPEIVSVLISTSLPDRLFKSFKRVQSFISSLESALEDMRKKEYIMLDL